MIDGLSIVPVQRATVSLCKLVVPNEKSGRSHYDMSSGNHKHLTSTTWKTITQVQNLWSSSEGLMVVVLLPLLPKQISHVLMH